MKKSIVLVHTVLSLATSFKDQLLNYLGEDVQIYNIWDDFLAINPNEVGEFTLENHNRLFCDLRSAELTGADLIVVTCSTLTPAVAKIRSFISIPVIAIDDAMGREAVCGSSRLLVLATAGSAASSTMEKLMAEAKRAGKQVVIDSLVFPEAFTALKQMEMEHHDELVLSGVGRISGYDCVVLAQASMAHLQERIAAQCQMKVLASPQLCMEEVKQELKRLNNEKYE
ncbi:MAG: aspartate/glutamate racemase family protein [Lachnospiraceae bacterium]